MSSESEMSFLGPLSKINSSAEEPFLAQETEPRRRNSGWPRISTIILSTTTLVFGLLSIFLLIQLQACSVQTFKDGYSTDWGKAFRLLPIPEPGS
jgi:hypothetical protein